VQSYLWGKLKHTVYSHNPDTEDNLQGNTPDGMPLISAAEIQCATNNVSVRCDACLWSKRNHFQHLLKHGM